MSKQLPTSYVVRQGDTKHAWRYHSRRLRDRTFTELGWLGRALVLCITAVAVIGGNAAPVWGVSISGDPNLAVTEAVSTALYARYLKRISAHMMNVASSMVNPFDRIGFRQEEHAVEE